MSDTPVPAYTQASVDSHSPSLVAISAGGDEKIERPEPRVRRRNRIIKSCLECRRRKLKCDKVQPCANCVKASRQCHFFAPNSDPAAQAKLAEVKEKMGILERSLEAELAQKRRNESQYSDDDEDDEIHNLDPSQMAEDDAAFYEDEEANDDIVDLGIAMGKVRITERIGGLMRPKFSAELSQWLKEVPQKDDNTSSAVPDQAEDWMLPSQEFVAPSSSFMFAPGVERTSIMHYLPSRSLVDKLMTHYWQAVHIIARTVHRPSFERQYLRFWDDVAAGMEPRTSFQAVVFAALLSSVVSMSGDHVYHEFGVNKQSLVENFRQGTESALSRANLLRTSKLETLQAFVMYLIPLCRAEVSRAHSALTGTCIRLAECMGLHRDPSSYSRSPIECQVRRLIWHQICFLDIRTCEATGPRPQIRPDDYDTQLPTNIDDMDLDRAESGEGGIEVKDKPCFTDMTISRMRFECYEMHRVLWVERPKIGIKKKDGERTVTVTSLLSRIQSFRARMEKTYLPMLSKSIPLHAIASIHYGIGSDRLYIHILQRFISSDKHAMPERLRQITMGASVRILEHSMNIEQQPALNIWSWYTGALHQFHAALLLLNEMYIADIDPALEQRVWACLDYTFELPAGGSGVVKTRVILKDLIEKLDIYANLRRWRAPKDMPQAGRRLHAAGHQPPQEEADEKRDDSGVSLQSMSSSNHSGSYPGNGNSTGQTMQYPQQPQYYPPPHRPRPVHPPSHTIAFPGAMPHTDWGTFDASVTDQTFQHLPTSAMPGSTVPTSAWMPPAPSSDSLSTPSHGQSSRMSSSGPSSSGPSSSSIATPAAANNPPDPLRDIDWNEIDQLFDGTHAGSGNMISPPFTFPPFEGADLQMPRETLR